jgi:beta-glucosidase
VVQVYASRPGSRVRRAPRELAGFATVAIGAGETAEVVVRIARDDLAHWDPWLRRWAVEGGEVVLAVGASSRDLRDTVTVTIGGDDLRVPLTADSTLAEWMSDPRGADVLGDVFAAAASGGAMAGLAADPSTMLFLGSLPLSRLAAFPGSPFTAATIGRMVAAAND